MGATKTLAYRKQKRRGKPALAFIETDGVRRYLGEYGSPRGGPYSFTGEPSGIRGN
jgi:hypothetical protein